MGAMPETCDGLELINLDADFGPHNCKWIKYLKNSRFSREMPGNLKRMSERGIKNATHFSLTLQKEHLDYIRLMARMQTKERLARVSPSQLIREVLEKAFPCPKTGDMFGEKKTPEKKTKKKEIK